MMNTDSLRQELYATLKADKRADTYVIPHRVMDVLAEVIATKVQEARIDEINKAELQAVSSDYVWRYLRHRQVELQALKDKGAE